MKQKLTLSLDRATIERVRLYAQERGKTVSQLASEYFDALTEELAEPGLSGRPGRDRPLPEAVEELIGLGEGTEEDVRRRLEDKHG